ncbi:hypothetical protein [Motilimonas sp. E26]|uniref:hypothetical protein n=1 Tax=Motilimonas sp. E26 TaxID=2865674 RepID=UPI001E313834|nr:hypothetical protein [Motilimonas sp. E26]MCE0558992.1 hypothetical protein [Motilimonas sp. E26]
MRLDLNSALGELANDYFYVNAFAVKRHSYWIACGEFIRKDTKELCTHCFQRRVSSVEEAEQVLGHFFAEQAERLVKPTDWERPDEVRLLVNRQVSYEIERRDMMLAASDRFQSVGYDESKFFETVNKLADLQHSHTLEVQGKLASLSESEVIQLVGDEGVYCYRLGNEEPGDRDLAKYHLFFYLLKPSERARISHKEFVKENFDSSDS